MPNLELARYEICFQTGLMSSYAMYCFVHEYTCSDLAIACSSVRELTVLISIDSLPQFHSHMPRSPQISLSSSQPLPVQPQSFSLSQTYAQGTHSRLSHSKVMPRPLGRHGITGLASSSFPVNARRCHERASYLCVLIFLSGHSNISLRISSRLSPLAQVTITHSPTFCVTLCKRTFRSICT